MKKLLLLLFVTTIISCKKQEFKTEIGLNLYSLEIPIDMKSAPNLNAQASFQYQSISKDLYTIVIVEDKHIVHQNSDISEINSYMEATQKMIAKNMDSNPIFKTIEKLDTEKFKKNIFEIEGFFSGLKIYYQCAIVESENYYYQILTWTDFSKKKDNADLMKHIIESFKEINPEHHKSHQH